MNMTDRSIHHALSGPLAIEPGALQRLLECGTADLERMHAAHESAASAARQRRSGTVALVPILGFTGYHSWLAALFGTATEQIIASVRQAANDPGIDAIVLWADSPGGEVRGVAELVAEISRARAMKPVIGVADAQAASAGYWVLSQVDRLFVSPSAEVGSIGVLTSHVDASGAYDRAGLRPTLITSTASPYKTEGADIAPLSSEARAHLQARVDEVAQQFIAHVATGRRTTERTVRETFGKGRMVLAPEAVRLGMADAIGTVDEAVAFAGGAAQRRVVARNSSRALAADALSDADYRNARLTIAMCRQTQHDGQRS
jgi:capsid assembly protease